MYKYRYVATIAEPNNNEFNFISEKDSLISASDCFNNKFIGKKSVDIIDVKENYFTIELSSYQNLENPTLHLSAYSRILCYEYEFEKFTSKKNRLLKLVSIDDTSVNKKLVNKDSEQANLLINNESTINDNVNSLEKYFDIIYKRATRSNDLEEIEYLYNKISAINSIIEGKFKYITLK